MLSLPVCVLEITVCSDIARPPLKEFTILSYHKKMKFSSDFDKNGIQIVFDLYARFCYGKFILSLFAFAADCSLHTSSYVERLSIREPKDSISGVKLSFLRSIARTRARSSPVEKGLGR